MLVTVEGIDGVGKTTQSKILKDYFAQLYGSENVLLTREPGGIILNEQIRDIIIQSNDVDHKAELLFFIAMRRQHFIEVIKPALNQNKIVICDRFIDSTIAYQGYGYGLDLSLIESLNLLATDNIAPNLTIIIYSETISSAVKSSTRVNKYEKMDISFYERVNEGFASIAESNPNRCMLIKKQETSDETSAILINNLKGF